MIPLPPDPLPPCTPHGPRTPDGFPWPLDERWRTEAVVGLARGIREHEAFERMPILADALQEAGCEDELVLRHCREPGHHHQMCWVVAFCTEGEFRRMPTAVPLQFRSRLSRELTPLLREEATTARPWWLSLLLAPVGAALLMCVLWLIVAGYFCHVVYTALRDRPDRRRG